MHFAASKIGRPRNFSGYRLRSRRVGQRDAARFQADERFFELAQDRHGLTPFRIRSRLGPLANDQ